MGMRSPVKRQPEGAPRVLMLDIETSPNVAHVWGMFKQNVGLKQLQDSSRVMCWAAKWYGAPARDIIFDSEHESDHREHIERIWELLDEADWIIHYNGSRFDIPTLNKEFIQYGFPPPSPYKQIDLLMTARKQFRFPSNKLDYVAQALGLGSKHQHEGHMLWVKCMAGDDVAWRKMKRYNIQDTVLLEKVYDRMLPWIPRHPNAGLFVGDASKPICPRCGGTHLQKRGFAYTNVSKFQQYRCNGCGTWSRGRANLLTKEDREGVLSNVT